ncbi:lipase family protein [Actinomadura scrupuli]|uniref:lipase family protein n=1 Tax=Actinomadura scrupuli TaxID=559629 RepID=UPI003D96CE6F
MPSLSQSSGRLIRPGRGRAPAGRRILTPLAVVVSLMIVAGTASAGTLPARKPAVPSAADDAFYVPPSPLPSGSPGDVIRSRPAKAGPPAARSLADAWQVMYLSTDALGRPDAVTGTILVPKGVDRSKAPIVGFGPGTHGPAFACTPSTMINIGAFYEQPAVNDMLAKGYAVAVTDYEGYHPSPRTTYVVGRSMGPALIDGVRAAQRLAGTGLSANAKVAFRGYSQGGGAAMWAGQLQPSYAPELDLVGVVGGGVPADLSVVALRLNGKPGFGFLAYALLGLDNAYPDLKLDAALNDAGRAAFAALRDHDCAVELLTSYQGRKLSDYTTSSPLADPAWQAAYAANRLGGEPIKVPVLQYHDTDDELVAFSQAQTLRDEYCALGVALTWKTYAAGHLSGVFWGNADALAFLDARMNGTPATSTC